MAEILNVDFNQLPRPVRERFVAITQGKAGPTPIFQQRASGAGTFGWILLLLLALLFGAGLLVAGFVLPRTLPDGDSSGLGDGHRRRCAAMVTETMAIA